MNTPSPHTTPDPHAAGAVAGVLSGYLLASGWVGHPWADGLTVGDVVAIEYPAALAAGQVPGAADLARRHPDLADGLAAFVAEGGGAITG